MALLAPSLRKSEKVLATFAVVTAAVWAIEPIHEILYPVWIVSFAVSLVLGSVVLTSRLAAMGQWVVRRTLRRVRYRMVAVVFFVWALPVTLSVMLPPLGVSSLLGPLTAYMLTTELRQVRERLDAVNGPLAPATAGRSHGRHDEAGGKEGMRRSRQSRLPVWQIVALLLPRLAS